MSARRRGVRPGFGARARALGLDCAVLLVLAAVLGFGSGAVRAEARVTFPSLAAADATPIVLTAHWFPTATTSASSRAPAVVLLHGCSGALDRRGRLVPRMLDYAAFLNARGFHALVVDSLTPRGETELCTQRAGERRVTQRERRRDALAAVAWLARRDDVEPGRIGLVGWSNGGSTVLAATNRRQPEVAAAPHRPAFAVAYYPGCATELKRGYESATPLLLLVGEADDWTPAEPCHRLAERAGPIKPEIVGYAGAEHGFDAAAPLRLRRDVPNGAHPGQGVHVGRDEAAAQRSREALAAFLARQ